jgi:hypothetical protein
VTIDECERESSVIAAVRGSASTYELENHVASCPACEETAHLAGSLLQHASQMSAENLPPAPGRIWRKMREHRQQFHRRRATRGLVLMWVFAAVYLVAVSIRYLPALWRLQSAELPLALSSLDGEMVLGSIAISVLLAAFGWSYLLVSGRRIDSRLL